MERIKLQNIVFSDDNSELYYHMREDGLYADGYFNLFDIAKRKKYTEIKEVILVVEATGYKSVTVMHDSKSVKEYALDGSMKTDSDSIDNGSEDPVKRILESRNGISHEIEITIPYSEYDEGAFWIRFNYFEEDINRKKEPDFVAENGLNYGTGDRADKPKSYIYIEAAYYGIVEEKRDAEICIGMCTYKREDYVKKNARFVESVIGGIEDVSDHLSMYIVDNGHTLNPDCISESEDEGERGKKTESGVESVKLEKDKSRIRIFSNVNAGGASGFTRAMIEAIRARKEKKFTHILLMDDDVTIMSDLFVRLYGVLCTLKDEYKDIRIGGELLRKDFPWVLNARGEWSERYLTESENHLKDLRNKDVCLEVLSRKVNDERLYTGWWCACYSLDMIEKTSLPLPLFIHDDDISFERDHAEYKILFLNGISVWHNGFELSNYGVNQYYHIRNKLIGSSLYEPEIKASDAAKWVVKCMVALLISYRYKEIEYIAKAVRDFMKGPEWLQTVDSEKLNSELLKSFSPYRMREDDFDMISRHKESGKDLSGEEFDSATNKNAAKNIGENKSTIDYRHLEIREDIKNSINGFREKYDFEVIKKYSSEDRMSGHLKEKLTLNGWILPAKYEYVGMTLLDSPFKAYRARKIILFDPESEKSVILEKDYKRFCKSVGCIVKSVVLTGIKYSRVAKLYREEKRFLTSKENWEKRLDI